MPEKNIIEQTTSPITVQQMIDDLGQLRLEAGQTVLVHSSMSKLGWVCGGTQAVIRALMDVLGDEGTLMMPTHSAQNTNPANWRRPPVPEAWWQTIRENRPAFDPSLTQTREMGAIPEAFRKMEGVKRSHHPVGSFAAIGKHADFLLANHDSLEQMFDDTSPLGKLYELDGHILLLGVSHSNNTSLHLAEYRAEFPKKPSIKEGVAMLVNGKRQWVEFDMHNLDDEDFEKIGTAYYTEHGTIRAQLG